ncbi:unnamed protein product [Pleuronectes platessa]|uniref:Uncharacterized protein n=1 Tax=Pleuronectes platessa TaxID=8262 RepID=A0A9N7Y927_PLEPL|nr:unnamed protein product [Pleuronectes platessa]
MREEEDSSRGEEGGDSPRTRKKNRFQPHTHFNTPPQPCTRNPDTRRHPPPGPPRHPQLHRPGARTRAGAHVLSDRPRSLLTPPWAVRNPLESASMEEQPPEEMKKKK